MKDQAALAEIKVSLDLCVARLVRHRVPENVKPVRHSKVKLSSSQFIDFCSFPRSFFLTEYMVATPVELEKLTALLKQYAPQLEMELHKLPNGMV